MSIIVAALGGNALLQRGQPLDAAIQKANIKRAAESVAEIATYDQLVLTHGNGPQVGLLALQSAAYDDEVTAYPLDVLDAETEGMIGYLLEQELSRHLPRELLATLLTQVVVDREDPAFDHPTKPIGPVYSESEAVRVAAEHGWSVAPDGAAWRRVVPSPEPREIVEIETIRRLVESGVVVTCAGGGGIPVVEGDKGRLVGVEAVIDKDLVASLLAAQLGAEALILLTDVEGVFRDFGTPSERLVRSTTPDKLRAMNLPAGSMGPKVEAACRFVESGGAFAAIGRLDEAFALTQQCAGTLVRAPRKTTPAEKGARDA